MFIEIVYNPSEKVWEAIYPGNKIVSLYKDPIKWVVIEKMKNTEGIRQITIYDKSGNEEKII